MHPNQSAAFVDNAHKALENPTLQRSLHKLKGGFQKARIRAAEKLPEFEVLRDRARDIKTDVVPNPTGLNATHGLARLQPTPWEV